MTLKDTVKAHGELRALDLSDQTASFLIFLAFRTLWAEKRWRVSRDTRFSVHPKGSNAPGSM